MAQFLKKEPVVLKFGLKFSSFKTLSEKERRDLSENGFNYFKSQIESLPFEFGNVSRPNDMNYSFEDTLLAVELKDIKTFEAAYQAIEKEIQSFKKCLKSLTQEELEEIAVREIFQAKFKEKIDYFQNKQIVTERYQKLDKKLTEDKSTAKNKRKI